MDSSFFVPPHPCLLFLASLVCEILSINCSAFDYPFSGTGASGKSTFLKQLKVLHKKGFSPTEVDQFKESLPTNALHSMQKLVQHMIDNTKVKRNVKVSVCIAFSLDSCQAKMTKIIDATELDEEIAAAIDSIWQRPEVQEVFKKKNELNVQVESAAS